MTIGKGNWKPTKHKKHITETKTFQTDGQSVFRRSEAKLSIWKKYTAFELRLSSNEQQPEVEVSSEMCEKI